MNGTSTSTKPLETLSNDVHGIHLQLAALQHQSALMTRALAAITRKIDEISPKEEVLCYDTDNIERELPQFVAPAHAATLCPACGGPLDRHPAACGDLLICTACGFSEFVDESGIVSTSSLPPAPPNLDSAVPPPSWVG